MRDKRTPKDVCGEANVAWKRKMLRDVIGGHQEYIFMKRLMAHRILQLAKTTRGYQTTRAFARDEIIKSLRSPRSAPSFARNNAI